jgi:polyisoprenoid-binding protein YceI
VLAAGALALAPQGEFRRYSVEKIDDHTARVSGDLTLLAITKPLTVNVSVRRRRPKP